MCDENHVWFLIYLLCKNPTDGIPALVLDHLLYIVNMGGEMLNKHVAQLKNCRDGRRAFSRHATNINGVNCFW